MEKKHKIILVHGIRTQAEWQQRIAKALEVDPELEVMPTSYGFFDVFRFLLPLLWLRKGPINRIKQYIRIVLGDPTTQRLSIIAHSFGSYIISKILEEEPDIRLHGLILCGSVIPDEFQWGHYQHRIGLKVINDCGDHDIWPILARSCTWGYGSSGRLGFGHPQVTDRFHNAAHSDLFSQEFAQEYWLPYLSNGKIVEGEVERPPTSWLISLLTTGMKIRNILIAAVLFVVVILAYVFWPFSNPINTPQHLRPYDNTHFDKLPRNMELQWQQIQGAVYYLVEIQYEIPDSGQWHVIPNYPVAVEGETYPFEFPGAQRGRWRVIAVDENGTKSKPSEWWYFLHKR